MSIQGIRTTAITSQEQHVYTPVGRAFDDQAYNLERFSSYAPEKATNVFLGTIGATRPAGQSFAYNKGMLESMMDSNKRNSLEGISREDLVFSAYSFLNNFNGLQPKQKSTGDMALANFIKGPVFKTVLDLLFREELTPLIARDYQILQQQAQRLETAKAERLQRQLAERAEAKRQGLCDMSEPLTTTVDPSSMNPDQAKAKQKSKGKGILYRELTIQQRIVINKKVSDLREQNGKVTIADLGRIVMEVKNYSDPPGQKALTRLRDDLNSDNK